MKKSTKYFVTINNKKHFYTLKSIGKKMTFFECKDANIAQEFLNEDIANLLVDLPNLIVAEKEYKEQQDDIIRFRVSSDDKKKIEKRAAKEGYSSISAFLRDLALGS